MSVFKKMGVVQGVLMTAELRSRHNAVRIAAWLFALLLFCNVVYFVLRVSSPVISQDAWYFLDVFLRKAITGNLEFSDFFVKRHATDHAQPLFKLIMLFEWRYFDLDFVVEALLGVAAAGCCAIVLYRIMAAGTGSLAVSARRHLAWLAVCAVLFSLNGDGSTWRWSLVALENITTFIILIFMVAVWHSHRTGRYKALFLATLILDVTSDDSAVIAVVCTIAVLGLVMLFHSAERQARSGKLIAVVVCVTIAVRLGYSYAPIVSVQPGVIPADTSLSLIWNRFEDGGWWKWLVMPLSLAVSYTSPVRAVGAETWTYIQWGLAVCLIVAHIAFWRRAVRASCHLAVFVAMCLMALTYAWVLGIIYGRVTRFGNDYLLQPRYVLLYAGHVIALLIMCSDAFSRSAANVSRSADLARVAGVVACAMLIALQVPISINAWAVRKYEWAYEIVMAKQIDQLAAHPQLKQSCVPELPVCAWSPERRRYLTTLLSRNHLNVFSDAMRARHPYLPQLLSIESDPSPDSRTDGVAPIHKPR